MQYAAIPIKIDLKIRKLLDVNWEDNLKQFTAAIFSLSDVT